MAHILGLLDVGMQPDDGLGPGPADEILKSHGLLAMKSWPHLAEWIYLK